MKRSRSGTKSSRRKRPSNRWFGLALAALAVLAFCISFALGLRGGGAASPPPTAPAVALPVPVARGRVEVFNASREPGLARLATDRLRAVGFDVVQFGNAHELSRTSVVLVRAGAPEVARAVAQELQIDSVETALDADRYVEVTVLLGADWKRALRP